MCAQHHLLGCSQLFLPAWTSSASEAFYWLLIFIQKSRAIWTQVYYVNHSVYLLVYPVTSTNLQKCDNMCFVSCHAQHHAKFEVLAAVVLKAQVLWDTMPCCAMSDSDISEDCITFIFERTWRHYNPSKCPNTLTQWHRSTFQKPESRMWSAHWFKPSCILWHSKSCIIIYIKYRDLPSRLSATQLYVSVHSRIIRF